MNAEMTPEEYAKFAHAMGNRLREHFDGFAIVGFHATSGQPVIFTDSPDFKTRCALTELLRIALVNNSMPQHPPDNGSYQNKSTAG